MTPGSDPFRTLGLEPGATPAEIKRAYRRLAKAYHPDSAGERALPRFLAIQAAYERLTDGPGPSGRTVRKPSDARPAGESPGGAPPGRSWRADAERARATREAYRRRANRSSSRPSGPDAGPDAGPAGSTGGATGPTAGSTAGPGGTGATAGRRGSQSGQSAGPAGPAERPQRGAGRKAKPKATIGSTSYDGTENEPFEPGWSGATWYGAASGTYWTINPKEYADPRKHGPEYLARARRSRDPADAAGQPFEPAAARPGSDPLDDLGTATEPAGDRPTADRPTSMPGDEPETSSSAASAASAAGRPGEGTRPEAASAGPAAFGAPAAGTTVSERARSRPAAGERVPSAPFSPNPPIPASRLPNLRWIDPGRIVGSWRGRIALAALAWFPIGLAIFWIHGQATGCAQFLASCTEPVGWSVWIPQVVVFGLLLLSPRLSWIAASASIGLLIVALPVAGLLTSISGGRAPSSGSTAVLVGGMTAGWLAGVAIAVSGRIPLPPWRSRTMRQ